MGITTKHFISINYRDKTQGLLATGSQLLETAAAALQYEAQQGKNEA